jgi:hypothetical protein
MSVLPLPNPRHLASPYPSRSPDAQLPTPYNKQPTNQSNSPPQQPVPAAAAAADTAALASADAAARQGIGLVYMYEQQAQVW